MRAWISSCIRAWMKELLYSLLIFINLLIGTNKRNHCVLLGSHNRSREWAKLLAGVQPEVIRKLQLSGKNQLIHVYTVRWQRLCACMCLCVYAERNPTFCIFSIKAFIQNICIWKCKEMQHLSSHHIVHVFHDRL